MLAIKNLHSMTKIIRNTIKASSPVIVIITAAIGLQHRPLSSGFWCFMAPNPFTKVKCVELATEFVSNAAIWRLLFGWLNALDECIAGILIGLLDKWIIDSMVRRYSSLASVVMVESSTVVLRAQWPRWFNDSSSVAKLAEVNLWMVVGEAAAVFAARCNCFVLPIRLSERISSISVGDEWPIRIVVWRAVWFGPTDWTVFGSSIKSMLILRLCVAQRAGRGSRRIWPSI